MGVMLKSMVGLGTVYALMFAPVADRAALAPAASLCAQAATAQARGDAPLSAAACAMALSAIAAPLTLTQAEKPKPAAPRPVARSGSLTDADLAEPWSGRAACRENRRAEDSAGRRNRLFEASTPEASLRTLDAIREDFAFLEDWEDRYRYVIELGRELEAFPDSARNEANKVRGCVSQVWIEDRIEDGVMRLKGDSDSHLVRGLVAIAASLYDGKTPPQALEIDARAAFAELGLEAHLTPQRSNGVRAMIDRIRADAATFAKA